MQGITNKYNELIMDKQFQARVESGTTDERNVESRLKATKNAMKELD